MPTKPVLAAALVLLASLVAVPNAAAFDACTHPLPAGDNVRDTACVVRDAVAEQVLCFYREAPEDWLSICIN